MAPQQESIFNFFVCYDKEQLESSLILRLPLYLRNIGAPYNGSPDLDVKDWTEIVFLSICVQVRFLFFEQMLLTPRCP